MQHLGIDGRVGVRRGVCAATAVRSPGEGVVPADEDGLVKLVLAHGTDVKACVETMSGAVRVRDRLPAPGRSRCPISAARRQQPGGGLCGSPATARPAAGALTAGTQAS